MYGEFKYSKEFLLNKVEEAKNNLWISKNRKDFLVFALDAISKSLLSDKRGHLDFGVYWWSLKEILVKNGFFYFGEVEDQLMANMFNNGDDEQTVVAAIEYRRERLAMMSKYEPRTSAGEEVYILDDGSMNS